MSGAIVAASPRPMLRRVVSVSAAAAVGLVGSVAIAVRVGAKGSDALELVAVSGGAALLAGVVGWAIVRALRSRSLQLQVLVVALVAVVGTALGVVAAAEAMFISTHDLRALGIVLFTAAGVAVGGAIACTDTVAEAAAALHGAAQRIGGGPDPAPASPRELAALPAGDLAALATALEDTRARLDTARRRQRALEDDRRALVAAMSHDLRAPLATVRAMAEALEDGVVDDRATVDRYHRVIRAESERLTLLVDALFELSRIESGSLEVDRERSALLDIVVTGVEAAQHAGLGRSVVVTHHVAPEVAGVSLPQREATRIVANLLDNAVRHSRVRGSVRVEASASPGGAGICLDVHDSCGGIPVGDLDRVFETAFRGDAARRRDASGGGLGLSITKGLVELLGGTVEVANHGDGCCFRVVLPTAVAVGPVQRSLTAAPPG